MSDVTVKTMDLDLKMKLNSLSESARGDLLDFLGNSPSGDNNLTALLDRIEASIQMRLAKKKSHS